MTRYYAGPPEWRTQGLITGYAAPAGVFSWIDLRNMGTQSAANHSSGVGNGFFCTPDDVSLPSEYTLIGTGDLRETNISGQAKSAWASLYGVSLNGGVNTILDALSYTLGDGSDPDGDTAPKPLMPGVAPQNEVQIVLAGHSVVYRRTMNLISGTSKHAKKCRDRIQKDLSDIAETDEELFRKCLGRVKEKCGLKWDSPNESWALNAKTKNKSKGKNGKTIAEKPATVYTESWPTDGAITSGQDRTWTYITGSALTVNSGYLRQIAANSTANRARMNSALSSSDVYAKSAVKSYDPDAACGSLVRKDSNDATNTLYYTRVTIYGGVLYYYLYKIVTGTPTTLATPGGFAYAVDDVMKLEANGSAIKGYQNATERVSSTDTAISSGTYCGVYHECIAANHYSDTDSFECGDLAAGATRPDLGLLLGVS